MSRKNLQILFEICEYQIPLSIYVANSLFLFSGNILILYAIFYTSLPLLFQNYFQTTFITWVCIALPPSPKFFFLHCGITVFTKQINIYFVNKEMWYTNKQATQRKQKKIAYHTVYKFIVSTGCINKMRWTTNFHPHTTCIAIAFNIFNVPNIQFILHVDERRNKKIVCNTILILFLSFVCFIFCSFRSNHVLTWTGV